LYNTKDEIMKITQAKKLSAILRFGTLSMIPWSEVIKEEEDFEANPNSESSKSLDYRINEISQLSRLGKSCWEFKPNEKEVDLERTRMYSDNPFDLIDSIFRNL